MSRLSAPEFDVLIIGGGITGCGVARDAAMRGLSVALFERDDFGSGTSGRSSRLIHGGIRYLEHGQLHLVHESIRERQTLLKIAPHLVRPLAFTWPVYRGARLGKLKLAAGLFAYDLLSRGRARRHEILSVAETLEREPSLKRANLTGGALYYDACTDDARLTLANALDARREGASVENHAVVSRIMLENGKAVGVEIRSALSGGTTQVRGRIVVDATGAWDNAASADEGARRYRGSKGVHIAVDRKRIGNREALTLVSPIDGRVMFCLPAGPEAIIGTTDTWTTEFPETVHADDGDVEYLLQSANAYFPEANLGVRDVVSAWAGIRPLAKTSAATPGAVSREHAIVRNDAGVIEVTGGKLTTYRAMAAEIGDKVEQALGRKVRRSPTDHVELPGAEREPAIAALCRQDDKFVGELVPGLPYTGAHFMYAIRKEMAQTLSDLLIRRTHLAFETRDHGVAVAPRVADLVSTELGWNEKTKSARIREYKEDIGRMFAIGKRPAQ